MLAAAIQLVFMAFVTLVSISVLLDFFGSRSSHEWPGDECDEPFQSERADDDDFFP